MEAWTPHNMGAMRRCRASERWSIKIGARCSGCSDGVVNSSCDKRKRKLKDDPNVAKDAPVPNYSKVWSPKIGILRPIYFFGRFFIRLGNIWGRCLLTASSEAWRNIGIAIAVSYVDAPICLHHIVSGRHSVSSLSHFSMQRPIVWVSVNLYTGESPILFAPHKFSALAWTINTAGTCIRAIGSNIHSSSACHGGTSDEDRQSLHSLVLPNQEYPVFMSILLFSARLPETTKGLWRFIGRNAKSLPSYLTSHASIFQTTFRASSSCEKIITGVLSRWLLSLSYCALFSLYNLNNAWHFRQVITLIS